MAKGGKEKMRLGKSKGEEGALEENNEGYRRGHGGNKEDEKVHIKCP